MQKLFLSSSFSDVAEHFQSFVQEECAGKTVTFIPTASMVEKVNFYVGSAKKAFKKMGIIIDELDISKTPIEVIEEKIINNEYIYMSGGNTFYLLQELKKTGADKLIANLINKGKVFIGESAGSMILAQNIEYVKLMDDCSKGKELDNYDSLGVINFSPVPHYTNFPFKKAVEKIITEYSSILDLYPITNKQAIIVSDNEVSIIG